MTKNKFQTSARVAWGGAGLRASAHGRPHAGSAPPRSAIAKADLRAALHVVPFKFVCNASDGKCAEEHVALLGPKAFVRLVAVEAAFTVGCELLDLPAPS
jgi:hypothetical protein